MNGANGSRGTSDCAALAVLVSAVLSGCYRSTPAHPDLGTDASVPRVDGTVDPAPSCADEIVEPYAGAPPCSDRVRRCAMECSSGECTDRCLESEPECLRCYQQTTVSCLNEVHCQRVWGEFACCTDEQPACDGLHGIERLACAPSCAAQIDAFAACTEESGARECYLGSWRACGLIR